MQEIDYMAFQAPGLLELSTTEMDDLFAYDSEGDALPKPLSPRQWDDIFASDSEPGHVKTSQGTKIKPNTLSPGPLDNIPASDSEAGQVKHSQGNQVKTKPVPESQVGMEVMTTEKLVRKKAICKGKTKSQKA
ncbi:uncharacterized protein MELLADRAFT_66504 [Melampsora larici-populina 98AG31]|uniref:Uncharacterized protein n=1 Tax=Melampsora larici-populina (strain 98AG31 / pathotype 3-4-7) TaxID=747676 RepID=F4RZG7_MELLP|nr:uncharacterized protein MELLADRAFT_66504 [Melampsora larici-populina 98AG31]EGG02222.1 hypothetical protein MELLADRAFT_66504 [Melampsora larici-populina 98AG31]